MSFEDDPVELLESRPPKSAARRESLKDETLLDGAEVGAEASGFDLTRSAL